MTKIAPYAFARCFPEYPSITILTTASAKPKAILADALEEAGCTHADILNHCRELGEHVRGCWVVDLLLGKT